MEDKDEGGTGEKAQTVLSAMAQNAGILVSMASVP